jgi:tetratricopeptide (TPR) repeat protein
MTSRSISLFSVLFCFTALVLAQEAANQLRISNDKVSNIIAEVHAKPDDSKTRDNAVEMGFDLLAAGRFQEGLTVFTAITYARPSEYRALYGSALASFNLGEMASAEAYVRSTIETLQTVVNVAPQSKYGKADALVLLGVILAVKGDSGAALSAVTEAARIAPKSFDAQFALGRALYGTGDPKKAALAFEEAIALRPSDIQSRFFLATALEAVGEYESARKAYSDLIAIQPDKAEGHLGLGVLLVKLGGDKKEQGIEELRKAISLNGNLYEARVTLGREQVKLGRFDEALENLARAAELAPNNPEPHYQLAIAYRRLGKKVEAERESAKVKEINSRRRGVGDSSTTNIKSPH